MSPEASTLYLAAALGAALLSLLFFVPRGGLAALRAEFETPGRLFLAVSLLVIVLTATVFLPALNPGIEPRDLEDVSFGSLFIVHLVLGGFVVAWWLLRRPTDPRVFLFLDFEPSDVRLGLLIGLLGWAFTLATAAVVGLLMSSAGLENTIAADPRQVPEVMRFLAEMPVSQKLLVILAAMTIEEAFFRGFLQPRFGYVASSVLFALGHAGYGIPTLLVGVFVLSLILGSVFRRTGRLLPAVIAHGVFDAIQLLFVIPAAVRAFEQVIAG